MAMALAKKSYLRSQGPILRYEKQVLQGKYISPARTRAPARPVGGSSLGWEIGPEVGHGGDGDHGYGHGGDYG